MKKNICFRVIVIFFVLVPLYSEEKIEYRISTTNNLNLRVGPGLNYKVIKTTREGAVQLVLTELVKVLKIDEKEETINGYKGRWVYIDPGYSDKICGWVFDYYLAKKEDFNLLESLPNNLVLSDDDGDTLIQYKFYKDGRVELINGDSIKRGRLYIEYRKKIVIVKYEDQNELFLNDSFIYNNGILCERSGRPGGTCSKIIQ